MKPTDLVEFPIDGTLDLHTFDPREVKDLVVEYLRTCRERGIVQVRIVLGMGKGVLLNTVLSVLGMLPEVISFHLGDETAGGWGATIVYIRPEDEGSSHRD